jgi:hypothetical protein
LWQWYGDDDDGRPVLIKYGAATLILVMSPFYLYYSHKGCCQLTAGLTWFWTALMLMWNSVTPGYYGAWYYRTGTDRKNVLVADYGHDNWDDVVRQLGKEGLGPDGRPPPLPPPRLTPTARSSRPLASARACSPHRRARAGHYRQTPTSTAFQFDPNHPMREGG